jgi:hypothetical protein
MTLAMTAGISDMLMKWSDIVEAMHFEQPAKKRGSYKKHSENEA